MHVIIIGAGCTGLLIAQGLKKAHIPCTVFEASAKDRSPRDWSMMLHWGKEHLQETLPEDIARQFFEECDTDTIEDEMSIKESYNPVYNGKTGEVLVDLPWPSVRRYSRASAVKVLSQGLDIRMGKRLTGINTTTAGVEATFEDGTMASGDMLVGADSANSFVRSWLFDNASFAKASDMPLILNNVAVQFPEDLAVRIRSMPHPLQKLCIHPDLNAWLGIMSLKIDDISRPDTWVFHLLISEWTDQAGPSTNVQRLDRIKTMAMEYAEPFRSALLSLDEKVDVRNDRLKYWAEPKLWDNRGGRVTLAGDAAHPFPPHRGQGLNNSFQDAALLVEAIVRSEQSAPNGSVNGGGGVLGTGPSPHFVTVLKEYDAEVFERGRQEIKVSYDQAYAATHLEAYLESAAVKHGLKPVPK